MIYNIQVSCEANRFGNWLGRGSAATLLSNDLNLDLVKTAFVYARLRAVF